MSQVELNLLSYPVDANPSSLTTHITISLIDGEYLPLSALGWYRILDVDWPKCLQADDRCQGVCARMGGGTRLWDRLGIDLYRVPLIPKHNSKITKLDFACKI